METCLVPSHEVTTENKSLYYAVYAYPILKGKTEVERQRSTYRREKADDAEYQAERMAYRSAMKWTDVKVWIQQFANEDLHIMLLKSPEPMDANSLHQRFRDCCERDNLYAKEVRNTYIEAQNMNFCQREAYADLTPVPSTSASFSEEELEGKTISEFAFAYPLLPGQKERVQAYNQKVVEDPELYAHFSKLRKKLGIVEKNMWIQSGFGRDFLVVQEKLIDPLDQVCDTYLKATKERGIMEEYTQLYYEATGLTVEEMLPKLEAL